MNSGKTSQPAWKRLVIDPATEQQYFTPMERVPLFPLGLVLLPRMPLPLHIFEERYRLMVQECIDRDSAFGVLLHTGTKVQTVGCLARIESVINSYDDGRKDILTVGTERFKVRHMYEEKAYLEGDIELFKDVPENNTPENTMKTLREDAVASLKGFARAAGYNVDDEFLGSLETEELSFLLATTDVFSIEEKQKLLEMRSSAERLRLAARSLSESSHRREMTARIREILGKDDNENIDHIFN